jgi:hypothetical protein
MKALKDTLRDLGQSDEIVDFEEQASTIAKKIIVNFKDDQLYLERQ